MRLSKCIAARTDHVMAIDDLLLSEPLEPVQLADAMRGGTPFRSNAPHAGAFAKMLVSDGLDVVLGKGYVSEAEGHKIIRFATALGCTEAELRAMSDHLALWL